ncbi:putative NAD(P)-binding domain-containing protein [Seiridium cardinale]|uniref:NAD(P)-binding domain-containing protein n=1 Tax=Seiridium cardinale TaxID=138064 RepID=A0ABR2Y1U9_9PEZI
MKLVIGGSSGFVGAELVRQALTNPAITSIIGLSRRETPVLAGSADNAGKLKSIVCEDFGSYSDDIKKELEDADACIWTIAVTPSKMKTTPWGEVVKICRDYTLVALRTIAHVPRKHDGPLRFVYISGHFAPRDRAHIVKPLTDFGLVEVALMRGQLEAQVLEYAEQSNGAVEACIAKPGMIHGPGMDVRVVPGLPNIELHDIAAALLNQVVDGFEKDTLSNDDMSLLGQKVLSSQKPIV